MNSPGRASRLRRWSANASTSRRARSGLGADERRDRVQRVEDEVRLHLRLQRGRRRASCSSESCSCAESWSPSASSVSTAVSSSGEPAVAKATTAPAGPSVSAQRHDRRGAERARRVPALGAERRAARAAARRCGERLVDRADRLVARARGGRRPRRRTRARCVRVGDGDRAEAELLEELVGDRARGALGQAAPELGQRRLRAARAPAPGACGLRTRGMIGLCTSPTRSSRRCASATASRRELEWDGEITEREHALATYNPARTHDVTLFILDPDERIALIRKPHVRRRASGGRPAAGSSPARTSRPAPSARRSRRPACASSSSATSSRRSAPFVYDGGDVAWRTHVFLARDGGHGARAAGRRRDRRRALGHARRARGPAARAPARDGPRALALPRRAARRGARGAQLTSLSIVTAVP